MIAPYLLRLLCLSFAAFFIIHFVAGLAVTVGGRALVRAARRMRPRAAARFLLAMRLLPSALALFVVAGLCVPSYLWLEPEFGGEQIGIACLGAALLGGSLWVLSAARAFRGIVRASRNARECTRLGRPARLPEVGLPIWVLNTEAPLLALVGLFRSGVMLSSVVVDRLTPAQLGAALRHEEAHMHSRDNLKRLALLLTPGLLPGVHGFEEIERGWARFIEWAADDEAVAGDNQRSLSLAAALVRMARMGGSVAAPLTASFLSDCGDVLARVDRLLSPAPPAPLPDRRPAIAGSVLAMGIACAACLLHPSTLTQAHRIIEQLIH